MGMSVVSAQINALNAHRELSHTTNILDHEAIRVNPANIAFSPIKGKRFNLSFMQVDAMVYSKPLKRDLFHKNMGYLNPEGQIIYPKDNQLNLQQILSEELSVNAEIGILGMAYHHEKYGNFAFQINNRVFIETRLNDFANDVLFQGQGFDNYIDTIVQIILSNIENGKVNEKKVFELLDDSYIKVNMVQEYTLGYSRQLVKDKKGWSVYGGASLSYLLGYADIALRFNSGDIRGYVARMPLIEGDLGAVNMPANVNSRKRNGHGMKTGLGVTAINKKWTLGFSVVDVGFIKWPVNPVVIKQNLGNDIDLDRGLSNAFNDLVKDGIFYYQGQQNNIEVMPAKIVAGVSYKVNKHIDLYGDLIVPLVNSPKNLVGPLVSVGAEFYAFDHVAFKTGYTYNNKQVTMPTYLSLYAGKKVVYEFSLGTADLLSYFMLKRDNFQVTTTAFRFHF